MELQLVYLMMTLKDRAGTIFRYSDCNIYYGGCLYTLDCLFEVYKIWTRGYAVGGNAKSANTPELIFRRYGLEFLH